MTKKNKDVAIRWWTPAGKALDTYEQQTEQKVVTDKNFKKQISDTKQKKLW